MVGRPDSDEEDLVRNAVIQARNMGRRIARAVSRSPRHSQGSTPTGPSPSPASPSNPLALRGRDDSFSRRSPAPLVRPPAAYTRLETLEPSVSAEEVMGSVAAFWRPLQSRENTPLSPTMPANTNATGKGSGSGSKSSVGTDADSIMPLLFAAMGNPTVNFKKMAAMDSEGRTESSFEHKFRKWRQQARELAEKFPEHAGPVAERTPKKPRAAPAKKATNGKAKQTGTGDENGGDVGETGAYATAQEDGAAEAEGSASPTAAKGKAKAKTQKATATNGDAKGGNKKRGSEDLYSEADDEETPAKKPKPAKKGTAKVVKKSGAEKPKPEPSDEDVMESVEGKAKAKPKTNSRAKAAPKGKPAPDDSKKRQAPKVKEKAAELDDDAGPSDLQDAMDPELLNRDEEEMTEMEFKIEA